MVRLKEDILTTKNIKTGFQFLMVRLKVTGKNNYLKFSKISIPYGAIKRDTCFLKIGMTSNGTCFLAI